MRAIELAPVAARLAASPEDYPWSTYRHHAGMAANPFVSDHAGYWQLGNTPFDREAAYRALAAGGLPAERQAAVERSWRSGLPLGGEAYRQQIAAVTGRRTEPGRPGRPRKRSPDHPSSVPN
jgi:putative transposase